MALIKKVRDYFKKIKCKMLTNLLSKQITSKAYFFANKRKKLNTKQLNNTSKTTIKIRLNQNLKI